MQQPFEYDVITDPRSQHQLIFINNSTATISLNKIKFRTNIDIQDPWGPLSQYWKQVKKQLSKDGLFYEYELTLEQPITLVPGRNSILTYGSDKVLGAIQVGMPADNVSAVINNQTVNSIPLSTNGMSRQNPHPHATSRFYHADWGQYAYKKTADQEPYADINSINYAFIGFNPQGEVFSLDGWGDSLELPKIMLARKRSGYLDFSIAFGGWTNAGKRMDTVFSDMAKNQITRQRFVKNAVEAMIVLGANGIDIDWEYPSMGDSVNFVALITEIRQEFNRRGLSSAKLTLAAPAGKNNIGAFSRAEWQMIAGQVDEISVMTYDYFGAFSQFNDFHSAVSLSPDSPYTQQGGENSYFCINKTMQLYLDQGIDAKKLVLGIPNYSRSVVVKELGSFQGLYQPVLGAPPGEFADQGGIYSWNEILKKLRHQPSELDKLNVSQWYFYDSQHPLCQAADMCLLVGKLPDGNYVVMNFLDPNCAYRRALYAQNFGGAMVWANYSEADRHEDGFANAISKGLENQPYYFETHVPFSDRLNQAKNFTSERKNKLIEQISKQSTVLQSDQNRNRFIFKVLSFLSNFIPGLLARLIRPFASEVARRALNIDGEEKNTLKIKLLGELLKVHTQHEAAEIISSNIKTLNQHRNPFKRILTAILPDSVIEHRKWLQTETFKLAKKYQDALPKIIGLGTVLDMSRVQPPSGSPESYPEQQVFEAWKQAPNISHINPVFFANRNTDGYPETILHPSSSVIRTL